jgi:hypothetical protein
MFLRRRWEVAALNGLGDDRLAGENQPTPFVQNGIKRKESFGTGPGPGGNVSRMNQPCFRTVSLPWKVVSCSFRWLSGDWECCAEFVRSHE